MQTTNIIDPDKLLWAGFSLLVALLFVFNAKEETVVRYKEMFRKFMKYLISNKIACTILEFFAVLTLSLAFLSKMLFYLIGAMKLRPQWLDLWYQCYMLRYQLTRVLGLNPGGIWEGGFYYPFNKVSLLFDESSWGISVLIAPIWLLTKNIFIIFMLGSIPALFLSWIFTYYFVKNLGATKLCAFFAAATFCLSGVSLLLTSQQYCFWAFFLIPLLGLITLKIFSTSKLYWGVFWGIAFGYLAWCSAHLFFMGGVFLSLLILWNLLFNNRSKNTLVTLLTAFIIAGVISGFVIIPMYLVYKKFQFSRGFYQFHDYASNWINLFYRNWPPTPFSLIAKMPLWGYLQTQVRGEVGIGISPFLLFSVPAIFFIKLKESLPLHRLNKYFKRAFLNVIILSILFAFLNMQAILARCAEINKNMTIGIPVPQLAAGLTYLCYIIVGICIYFLRDRIKVAIKQPDFFMLLCAFFFGLLAFGPYYLTNNNLVIASPVAFLQYHVIGFSGIQATARWGLLLSFTLSIAVAVFLSQHIKTRKQQIFAVVFMLITILDVSPGFKIPDFKHLPVYQWSPRATDKFLKNIPDNGAVLELNSFPVKRSQHVYSDNLLGYSLFSSLYHKKPLVRGYSSNVPHAISRYLWSPEDPSLSPATIKSLRKFGAKYWVMHVDSWSLEDIKFFKDSTVGCLKQIGELDNGKTLIYEDPDPKISVGPGWSERSRE
jgi:hypothetical protein